MPVDTRLVYGYHAVLSLLKKRPPSITSLFLLVDRQDKRAEELISLARTNQIAVQFVTRDRLTKTAGHPHHQGVIAFCKDMEHYREADLEKIILNGKTPPLFAILDEIQDPHNLGACLRTSDAAGVSALIIPKDNSASITPTVRKVACGAAEILPIITVTNVSRTLQKLKSLGIWLVGTDPKANTPIYKTDLTIPLALVFGNEERGLRRLIKEQCDFLAIIPMQGTVESLNISVAVGICLFEARRQRTTKLY